MIFFDIKTKEELNNELSKALNTKLNPAATARHKAFENMP